LIDIGGVAGSESLIPPKISNLNSVSAAPAVDLLAGIDIFGSKEPVKKSAQIFQSEEAIIHDKNGLQIKLVMSLSDTVVNAKAIFMNITPVNFKDVKFLVSTPKVLFSSCI
jgi:hypothetical protein